MPEKQREPEVTSRSQQKRVAAMKGERPPTFESAAPVQLPKCEDDLYCVPDGNGWVACPICREAIVKEQAAAAAAPSPVLTQPSDEPLKPSATLLIKLGSIIVHYQEMNSSKGHQYDAYALQTLENDLEVREWLSQMNKMAFLPVKR